MGKNKNENFIYPWHPNKNGNTAELAKTLMNGRTYETLDLADYKVYG